MKMRKYYSRKKNLADGMRHALQGSDILDKYSFSKIRTRLKYERDTLESKF